MPRTIRDYTASVQYNNHYHYLTVYDHAYTCFGISTHLKFGHKQNNDQHAIK